MFIERQQHPTIEFDPTAGQQKPTIAHYFSNHVDPFKSVLPALAESGEGERVLVVSAPLSELVDETIRLHQDRDFNGRMVVDEAHRRFFYAMKVSLAVAMTKLEQIEFVKLDDEENEK